MGDFLLSPAKAAELVGGMSRLVRLVKTGRLPYYEMGLGKKSSSRRFRREEIETCLASEISTKVATVYVVGFGGYVKIGFTTDFAGRFLDLQDHLPDDLLVYATFGGQISDERALHRRFASCRTRGEWFLKRGRLRTWILDGCPLTPAAMT